MSGQVIPTSVSGERYFRPEVLRAARRSRFMSQESLARELKVTSKTVARWETGQFEPSFRSVWKLADFFAVEPSDFYGNDKVAA